MTYNDVRKNENKGFSLVELIVVIAIMAVLVAVLAPSRLQYVERSRAQKDDSAMGEVTNAIMLALSDQDVYDEVLSHSVTNNYSCYIDQTTKSAEASGTARGQATKITTSKGNNATDQYMYDDNARLEDEQPYAAAGVMRGMTITFHPDSAGSNSTVFTMANGIVNEFVVSQSYAAAYAPNGEKKVDDTGRTMKEYGSNAQATSLTKLSSLKASAGAVANKNTYLYNRLRATIGDTVTLTSQTYRNSNYTVFIRMGSTGGNEAAAQDAIAVYGQWNGTNLFSSEAAPSAS